MMMTIALRFIPTLLDETDKIIAQLARGADLDSEPHKRFKAFIPVLVPLRHRVSEGRRLGHMQWRPDVTAGALGAAG